MLQIHYASSRPSAGLSPVRPHPSCTERPRTRHSPSNVVSPDLKGKDHLPGPAGILCLKWPETPLAFFVARARYRLIFSCLARTPSPFLWSCFPIGQPPAYISAWDCFLPSCRFLLPLAELHDEVPTFLQPAEVAVDGSPMPWLISHSWVFSQLSGHTVCTIIQMTD